MSPASEPAGCLADEAVYFHLRLFGAVPDPQVVSRYQAANAHLFGAAFSTPTVTRVLQRRLDAEAVEFVLRLRDRENVLTKKFQILLYVVESRSAYFEHFVNVRRMPIRACLLLVTAATRAGWLLLKGGFLVWRHRLDA